jgi:hypothetical protein
VTSLLTGVGKMHGATSAEYPERVAAEAVKCDGGGSVTLCTTGLVLGPFSGVPFPASSHVLVLVSACVCLRV